MSARLRTPGSPRLRVVLLIACTLLSAGCAGRRAGGGSSSPGGSFDVLTGEQIRGTSGNNLYDALAVLRPQWLRPRGRSSLTSPDSTIPVVYLYGVPYGDLGTLRSMNVTDVRRVEFIDAVNATTRWGTGHAGGVILVDLDRS